MIHAGSVFDELVGPADPDDWNLHAFFAEQLQNGASVAARQHVIFQSNHDLGPTAEPGGEFRINWFGEPGINDGAIETFSRKWVGSLSGDSLHIAQGEESHFMTSAGREILQHF